MTAGPRRTVLVVYDGIQPLDVTGPHEVFAGAGLALRGLGRSDPGYAVEVVGIEPGPVRSESGLGLVADGPLPAPDGPFDTVVVAGGNGAVDVASGGSPIVDWLAAAAPNARRVATVCSGTFIAAAAGLCDGRRVTTHWARAGQLAGFCPAATVEPDAIFVEDDGLWSSAGVTAGIDLALAMVEADVGARVAQSVARHLVVHVRRTGGQTQYAAPVWSDPPAAGPIARARDHVHDEPAADLSVPALAALVGMSERHFTRLFRTQVGEPPGRYVERVRVEAARAELERTDVGLAEIARRCGFGTDETMRRAFHRRLDTSPDQYRRHVRSTGGPTDRPAVQGPTTVTT